jgi:hypothetical protein
MGEERDKKKKKECNEENLWLIKWKKWGEVRMSLVGSGCLEGIS